MSQKVAPSVRKKQALDELLEGTSLGSGSQLLSDLMRLSIESVVQQALEKEQAEYLGRSRYERSALLAAEGVGDASAKAHRNGYEPGTLKTGEGVVRVELPQVRGQKHPYRSQLWQNLRGTSEQLQRLIQEMYISGMSTRDIEEALERSFGQFVLSKSSVSDLSKELTDQFQAFQKRDLSGFDVAYLFLDTIYEPLRRYGSKTGVLCCWGIMADGSRTLIALTTANSESFVTCQEFLRGLVARGLRPPLTITTDGAPGLIQAVDAIWPKSKRIRCWFHKMQNLEEKVPSEAWPAFKALVSDLRDAPDRAEAKRRFETIEKTYATVLPAACACLAEDLDASLNHLEVPIRHRPMVRTTNLVERSFVEERRRTKTIPHLWGESDLTRLVFAVLMRVSDRWSVRQFSAVETAQIYKLRKKLFEQPAKKPTKKKEKTKRRSASHAA